MVLEGQRGWKIFQGPCCSTLFTHLPHLFRYEIVLKFVLLSISVAIVNNYIFERSYALVSVIFLNEMVFLLNLGSIF